MPYSTRNTRAQSVVLLAFIERQKAACERGHLLQYRVPQTGEQGGREIHQGSRLLPARETTEVPLISQTKHQLRQTDEYISPPNRPEIPKLPHKSTATAPCHSIRVCPTGSPFKDNFEDQTFVHRTRNHNSIASSHNQRVLETPSETRWYSCSTTQRSDLCTSHPPL